jgi:hypothetical protein
MRARRPPEFLDTHTTSRLLLQLCFDLSKPETERAAMAMDALDTMDAMDTLHPHALLRAFYLAASALVSRHRLSSASTH